MISRTNRFHGRGALRRLQTRSQTVRGGMLALKYAPSNRQSYRLAVVVSRKVSKSAVVRNRIRRRLYENVRLLSGSFQAPYDLVFIAYDDRLANVPAAELTADVTKMVQKAGLTKPAKGRKHGIVETKET